MGLGSMFNVFAQLEPDLKITDVVTVPGVIWLFGLAAWFFAAMGRRQGKAQRWKWFLAYGLVIVAAYGAWAGWGCDPDKQQGFGPYLMDVASRAQYGSKKLVFSVWAVFVIPILSLPVMWFLDKRETKRMSELVS
jgi:hypothetical protein